MDIQMKFVGVSEIVGNSDLGLLVLVDLQEKTQLVIPCDQHMIHQFEMRIKKEKPTDRLLPEVLFRQLMEETDDQDFLIHISGIKDGNYITSLERISHPEVTPIRASDALLLAMIGKISIFVDEGLLRVQGVPFTRNTSAMPLPINVISNSMLQTALDKAIKEENYEMASHLRDELKRREKLDNEEK